MENLHRRLGMIYFILVPPVLITLMCVITDNLENIVVQLQESAEGPAESHQDGRKTGEQSVPSHSEAVGYKILSFLAKEFERFNESNHIDAVGPDRERSGNDGSSRKRRRLDENVSPPLTPITLEVSPPQPRLDDLNAIFEVYFSHIHPWIPMIHQGRLVRRLREPVERPKLEVVLQAMVLIGSRFIVPDDDPAEHVDSSNSEMLRSWIVSKATSSMCLESLQALIIVAFNDVSEQTEYCRLFVSNLISDREWSS